MMKAIRNGLFYPNCRKSLIPNKELLLRYLLRGGEYESKEKLDLVGYTTSFIFAHVSVMLSSTC